MKICVGYILAVLVLFGCGNKAEVTEGALTPQILNRHLVDLGPVRYTADDGWNWTCERVYVIIRQSSIDAEVRVYEKGYTTKRTFRRIPQYKAGSRNVTYHLVRNSVNDDWYLDTSEGEPVRKFGILKIRLALRTGEFREDDKQTRTAKITEPVRRKLAPAKESRDGSQTTEAVLGPDASIDELREAVRLIDDNLLRGEVLTFSGAVVTKDGKEIKCEILSETDESVRIRTEIGTMTVSRERILSLVPATSVEKTKALKAKADIEAMRRRKADIETRIQEMELAARTQPQKVSIEEEAGYESKPIANEEDLPNLRERVSGGDNLVGNGDFSDGLRQWEESHRSDTSDKWDITVKGDEDYLFLSREQSGNSGGTVGVYQELNADVAGFDKIILSLDVRILSHTLKNAGWWAERKGGSGEYPVKVLIYYRDATGTTNIWTHGFISEFQGETSLANFTRVPAGKWFHYDADLKSNEELIDMEFRRRGQPLPEPVALTAIKILGIGWDFEAAVDNLDLRGEM